MEGVDFTVVGEKMPIGTQICKTSENVVICMGRSC